MLASVSIFMSPPAVSAQIQPSRSRSTRLTYDVWNVDLKTRVNAGQIMMCLPVCSARLCATHGEAHHNLTPTLVLLQTVDLVTGS